MFQIKMRSQVKLSNLQFALFPLKWIIEHRARREDKPEQDILNHNYLPPTFSKPTHAFINPLDPLHERRFFLKTLYLG